VRGLTRPRPEPLHVTVNAETRSSGLAKNRPSHAGRQYRRMRPHHRQAVRSPCSMRSGLSGPSAGPALASATITSEICAPGLSRSAVFFSAGIVLQTSSGIRHGPTVTGDAALLDQIRP
jgi:hypothetical protein